MTARCVVVMVSAILLAGGLSAGEDKKGDKDRLQGEWVVVSVELAGRKLENVKDRKLVVKGDEWTAPSGGKFKFKIDATKSPKQLDLVSDLVGKEQTWPGIYKIEGDTLTFCRSRGPEGERPTEFKGGPEVFLMVLLC